MSDSMLTACSRCGERKPRYSTTATCKDCRREYMQARYLARQSAGICQWCDRPVTAGEGPRAWCDEHRERVKKQSRKKSWAAQGIDIDEERYEALLAKQHGACALCGEKPNERLAVDHCHRTGAVRGLLCMSCNVLLGHARDNSSLLRKAADYVERNERQIAA